MEARNGYTICLHTESEEGVERILATAQKGRDGAYVFEKDGMRFGVMVQEGYVRIERRGEIDYRLELKAGEQTQTEIATQYGRIAAGIRVMRMEREEAEEGCSVICEYAVEFGDFTRRHKMRFIAKVK